MAVVELEHIKKVYPGDVLAVDDFNLTVADGEFVVFVGPSGCGKSTTLRMIAGLEEITEGSLRIGGRLVNEIPPKDRDIAMVFQNYALYPHMTVYKNMAFGLRLRKFPKSEIDQRVRKAADILGIPELLDRKPKALSGGQRQRVAVGRAIVRDPACFLFDEPLSNLDAKLRVEMRAELKRLHLDLKTTTVYVTHDQEEAMTLGERVIVMKFGVIQQCDTPLRIYRHPVNRFVAGFVGTPPMNFFDGSLVQDEGELWFNEGRNRIKIPEWARDALAGKVGSKIVLGVRPEAMSLRSQGRYNNEHCGLDATIKVVEPLGDRMDVYLDTDDHERIVARVEADMSLDPDTDHRFYFDPLRLHFFEPGDDGQNLALEEEMKAVKQ